MFCISVAYPVKDGARFDFDYYATRHIPMVARLLGANAVRSEVRKGVTSANGSPAAFVAWRTSGYGRLKSFRPPWTNMAPRSWATSPTTQTFSPFFRWTKLLPESGTQPPHQIPRAADAGRWDPRESTLPVRRSRNPLYASRSGRREQGD